MPKGISTSTMFTTPFFRARTLRCHQGWSLSDFARLACAGVSACSGSASSLSSGAESRISCMGSELSTQKSFMSSRARKFGTEKTTV